MPMAEMTKAENVFDSLVGVDWARAFSVPTDDAPSLTEKNARAVAK